MLSKAWAGRPALAMLGITAGGLQLYAMSEAGQFCAFCSPQPNNFYVSEIVQLPEYLLVAPLIKMSPL